MLKKLLAMLLIASMLLAGFAVAEPVAEEVVEEEATEEEVAEDEEYVEEEYEEEEYEDEIERSPVAILYTNDVHCAIEDGVGYAGVAGYEEAFWEAGYEVLLVDNGDAVQGDAVGTLSQGEYIIDLMNELDYDIAVPGDHEFDYGMDQFMALTDLANFPYISANFVDEDGETVFDPYVFEDLGGWTVAFVGVSTPEALTSAPANFQDEEGNTIYGFCEGNEGKDLYAAVQRAVDDAREEGAEIVIVMSHLGTDDSSKPYTSRDLILNTTGIDAVLDGHSHTVLEGEMVKNAEGKDVILSSAGTRLQALGSLMIEPDGTLRTELHDEYTLLKDEYMTDYIDMIKSDYEESLEEATDEEAEDEEDADEEAADEEVVDE